MLCGSVACYRFGLALVRFFVTKTSVITFTIAITLAITITATIAIAMGIFDATVFRTVLPSEYFTFLQSCAHHSLPNDGLRTGKRGVLLACVFGINDAFLVRGVLGPPKAAITI